MSGFTTASKRMHREHGFFVSVVNDIEKSTQTLISLFDLNSLSISYTHAVMGLEPQNLDLQF